MGVIGVICGQPDCRFARPSLARTFRAAAQGRNPPEAGKQKTNPKG